MNGERHHNLRRESSQERLSEIEGPALPPSYSERPKSPRRRHFRERPPRDYPPHSSYSPNRWSRRELSPRDRKRRKSHHSPRRRSLKRSYSPRRSSKRMCLSPTNRGYSPKRHDSPPYRRSPRRRYSTPSPRSSSSSPAKRLWKAKLEEREEKDKQYTIVTAERVLRTVFVSGLPLRTTDYALAEWFEIHNIPVRDVQLQFDRHRRFKCCGFVEFYQKNSVPEALELSGKEFRNKSISICLTEAERNMSSLTELAAKEEDEIPSGPPPSDDKNAYRLYVGNLDYGITEELLQEIFGQFGPLNMCKMPIEPTGRSRGHAFIQYLDRTAALLAFYHVHAKELGGRSLRVDFTKDTRARDPTLPPPSVPAVAMAPPPNLPKIEPVIPFRPASSTSQEFDELDDEMQVSGNDRYLLTQMLAGAARGDNKDKPIEEDANWKNAISTTSLPYEMTTDGQAQDDSTNDAICIPPFPSKVTTCMVFNNMFDPRTQVEGFEKEIEIDIREVVEPPILHLFVDPNSNGSVYLKLENEQKAEITGRTVYGRRFDGRIVYIEYLDPEFYNNKFNLN